MNVPQADFTFSLASPFGGTRDTHPSSCSDEGSSAYRQRSPSVPESLSTTSPPPIFLFQDLNLSNSSENSNIGGGPEKERSFLTPTRSPSTYADQHNASPSPGPTRASTRGSIQAQTQRKSISPSSTRFTDAREHITRPAVSTIGTEQVKVPGAFPGDENSSENRKPASHTPTKNHTTSTIREEPLPSAPIYDSRLQTGLKDVKSVLASLADMMRLSELAQDQSSTLYHHLQSTERASKFGYPVTRTVGIIGDSGVGKSSLINSLLDQRSLSRSSSDGAACTCVVTEFRHTDDQHTGPFTLEAEFMTTQEMRDLIEELLVRFRQFYVASAYREISGADQQSCRASAERAWETFQTLFKGQPGLTIEFLSEDTDTAFPKIFAQLERWAYVGLARRPGGPDALEYSVIAGDLKECTDYLDLFTADSRHENVPSLWPFIRLIRVYLNSPILRTGLVLADMPGLRDENFARVRATERYLKHNCDEVFIVTNISRACSDQSVHDIIRRCQPDQPRRIICTRSDEVSASEAARDKTQNSEYIRRLNCDLDTTKKNLEEAELTRLSADDGDRAVFALKESQLRDQERELKFEIDRFLITKRNNEVSQELTRKYEGIRIFCVSNTLYSKHREGRHFQAKAYANLSGIRELRRYCQLVPAEAQMRATRAFLEHEIPALLGSLRQWALSGADSVTADKAGTLRSFLDDAEQVLRRAFLSPQAYVSQMQVNLKNLYNETVNQVARYSQDQWRDASLEISQEWAAWHSSTYKVFCAKFGSHSTASVPEPRVWNDELLQPAREGLSSHWETILDWLESQIESVPEYTINVFRTLGGDIEAHMHLAPHALQNLVLSMNSRRECIEDHIMISVEKLIRKTELVRMDMLHGHPSSFISGLMRPAYISCQNEFGNGSDRKRKNIMRNHLQHSRIFPLHAHASRTEYRKVLSDCFDKLEGNVSQEIESIVRDFRSVVAEEGQVHEACRTPELARALSVGIERAEGILNGTKALLQELSK